MRLSTWDLINQDNFHNLLQIVLRKDKLTLSYPHISLISGFYAFDRVQQTLDFC